MTWHAPNDPAQFLSALAGLEARATAAMALVGMAILVMRRSSAGARHCALAAVVSLVLLMPLLTSVLPPLTIASRWSTSAKEYAPTPARPEMLTPTAAPPSPARHSPVRARSVDIARSPTPEPLTATVNVPQRKAIAPGPSSMKWTTWLLATWLMGLTFSLTRLIASRIALARLARHCTGLDDAQWHSLLRSLSSRLKLNRRVRLLSSPHVSMPMTWGIFRPIVVLPDASHEWRENRRRIVLLHELTHVKRLDCLWLLIAKLARSVHWFNPLAWWCVARLRSEAERACDQRVLHTGESAPDYAEQLLRVVAVRGNRRVSDVLALGMARPSTLETRLRTILDPSALSRVLTPRRAVALIAMLALLLVPMSMLRLAAQTRPAPQKVTIRVVSPDGLPRSSAYVSNKLTHQNAAVTDADGRCEIDVSGSRTWFVSWPGTPGVALVTIPKGRIEQPFLVTLDSFAGSCYQRVTDGQGHGLPHISVVARVNLPDGASIESAPEFTDSAGYCESIYIPMIDGLTIQTAVTSPGSPKQWSQPTRISSHQREFFLPDLTIRDAASPGDKPAWVSIGGTVRGPDGTPVADAEVEVIFKTPPALGVRHHKAATDPSGRWTTLIPAEAEVTHLQISHPRFVIESGSIGSWGPSPEQLRSATAVTNLRHGARLEGIVRDESGSPVPDVLIITRVEMSIGMSGPVQDPSMGRTGKDGRFHIQSMDAGPHRLSTFSNSYLTSTADIDLRPGMNPVEFKVSKGGSVTGIVLDPQGKPVAGASVSASTSTAPRTSGAPPQPRRLTQTDATGHFRLDVLPKDKPFNLSASTPSAWGEYRGATVQDVPYLITIAPRTRGGTGNLITVLDDATGAPIHKYRLFDGPQLIENGPAEFSQGLRFTVDSKDGIYVRRAAYSKPVFGLAIRVIADGYLPTESPIVPGGESKVFVLRLKPGKQITGAVVDADGKAVGGAQVAWVAPDHQAFIDSNGKISDFYTASPEVVVTTQSDGRFQVPPGMPPGALVAVHPRGYTQLPTNDFQDGGTLRLSPWARAEGHLKRGNESSANVKIGVYPLDARLRGVRPDRVGINPPIRWMLSTTTRPDGSFTFEHLPAIPLAVGITELRGLSSRVLIDPKPNQTATVQIGGAGRAVTGVLEFPADLGITRVPAEVRPGRPRISILLRPASDPADDSDLVLDEVDPRRLFYSASVSDGQHFTFHDVPPGQYLLLVKVLAAPPQNPRGRFVAIGRASENVEVADGNGACDVGEIQIRAVPKPVEK